MTGPIIEFGTQEELNLSLKEWQTRLFLNDWMIKAEIVPLSELSDKNYVGENKYEPVTKTSLIRMGKFNSDAKNGICKMFHELTLVHELMHLKLLFADGVESTMEGNYIGMNEHILIEEMAKSLIMAKYDIPFNWFKNF